MVVFASAVPPFLCRSILKHIPDMMSSHPSILQYAALKGTAIFLHNHNAIITPNTINKIVPCYHLIELGNLKAGTCWSQKVWREAQVLLVCCLSFPHPGFHGAARAENHCPNQSRVLLWGLMQALWMSFGPWSHGTQQQSQGKGDKSQMGWKVEKLKH